MLNIEIPIYIFSGTVCFTLAMILMFVNNGNSKESVAYSRIKHLLAYCAFLDVFTDVIILVCQFQGVDYFVLDHFFVPVVYFAQMFMMAMAFFGLIYADELPVVRKLFFVLPVVLLVAFHVVFFVEYCGFSSLSLDCYRNFLSGRIAGVLSSLLYLVLGVELCVFFYLWKKRVSKYKLEIEIYFSGQQYIDGQKLKYMSVAFVSYFVLANIDFVISDFLLDLVLMLVDTVILILFVVLILNMQPVFSMVAPAVKEDEAGEGGVGVIPVGNLSQNDDPNADAKIYEIGYALAQWEKREDKPWMNERVTLDSVSEQMSVDSRLLSSYLNNVYKQNFNQWINKQKVDEIQRLINENEEMSFSLLADQTGFSSPSNMSRVFKQVTGMTPSAYKERLLNKQI